MRTLREPGGTPIGEEIRHTLKHSKNNAAMTAEAELLLMNASRAQLVREIIRPALAAGEMVLCDRFYDSTTAYQGYGRELDLEKVKAVIEFAVGETKPDLTLLLHVPPEVSAERLRSRQDPPCLSSATASRKRTRNFSSASRMATASSPRANRSASNSSTARSRWTWFAQQFGKSSSRACPKSGAGENFYGFFSCNFACAFSIHE